MPNGDTHYWRTMTPVSFEEACRLGLESKRFPDYKTGTLFSIQNVDKPET